MADNIILSKGSYSVTLQSTKIKDSLSNKIFSVTIPVTTGKQSEGIEDKNKVVDLLRITRTFTVTGYITTNQEKSDLINIVSGAGINGGAITMNYSDGGNKTSFSVYVKDIDFDQVSQDEPSSLPSDFAKFSVNVTLLEGVKI